MPGVAPSAVAGRCDAGDRRAVPRRRGPPGAGKTTLAAHAACHMKAALVDKDALEWPLANCALTAAGAAKDDAYYNATNKAARLRDVLPSGLTKLLGRHRRRGRGALHVARQRCYFSRDSFKTLRARAPRCSGFLPTPRSWRGASGDETPTRTRP